MTTASASFLEPLVERVGKSLTFETAREVLTYKIDRRTQRRLDALADKCTEGTLTPKEHAEYASLVAGLELLTLMQAHARAALARRRDAQ